MFLRKCILFSVIFCTMLIAQGCETAKGVGHDTSALPDKIRQADAWITEHLW